MREARATSRGELISDGLDISQPLDIELEYEVIEEGQAIIPNIHFYNDDGYLLFILHDFSNEWRNRPKSRGKYLTKFHVPANFFSEGHVSVRIALSTYTPFNILFDEQNALRFIVLDSNNGNTARGDYTGHYPGAVRPLFPSTTQFLDDIQR